MAELVSKVYGEALFKIAVEEQKTDILMAEAKDILIILKENPQFEKLMKHPKISIKEKEQILDRIFGNRISKEMTEFIKLLVNKGRYSELPEAFQYLIDRMKEEKQIGVAYVTTAVALSGKKKKAVEKRLLQTTHYKSLEMHYEVDETLIGGMIIRIKDRVVDSSIRTKLMNMRKQLLQISLGEMPEKERCINP